MKKLALTTGLFSLVMVLTSFNTTANTNDTLINNTTIGIDGNQSAGQSRKVDMMGSDLSNQKVSIDGNQSAGQSRKVD
ncbi:hypothetical protein [Flavobacterium pectinovorum]|uniref:hypothetical protein n=1 Tax=Flavobacterium pectinovorum TaxID=29533 RepID=UPI001FAE50BF|nr:hypothetical protein [Flavobacterium pectinovorum]MCI9844367.1 hypothetical protein [Flavobacterium pectinovorum]